MLFTINGRLWKQRRDKSEKQGVLPERLFFFIPLKCCRVSKSIRQTSQHRASTLQHTRVLHQLLQVMPHATPASSSRRPPSPVGQIRVHRILGLLESSSPEDEKGAANAGAGRNTTDIEAKREEGEQGEPLAQSDAQAPASAHRGSSNVAMQAELSKEVGRAWVRVSRRGVPCLDDALERYKDELSLTIMADELNVSPRLFFADIVDLSRSNMTIAEASSARYMRDELRPAQGDWRLILIFEDDFYSLEQWNRSDALPRTMNVTIRRGFTRMLNALLKNGLVHGDVKPGNVVLRIDANAGVQVRVIDFDPRYVQTFPPEIGAQNSEWQVALKVYMQLQYDAVVRHKEHMLFPNAGEALQRPNVLLALEEAFASHGRFSHTLATRVTHYLLRVHRKDFRTVFAVPSPPPVYLLALAGNIPYHRALGWIGPHALSQPLRHKKTAPPEWHGLANTLVRYDGVGRSVDLKFCLHDECYLRVNVDRWFPLKHSLNERKHGNIRVRVHPRHFASSRQFHTWKGVFVEAAKTLAAYNMACPSNTVLLAVCESLESNVCTRVLSSQAEPVFRKLGLSMQTDGVIGTVGALQRHFESDTQRGHLLS